MAEFRRTYDRFAIATEEEGRATSRRELEFKFVSITQYERDRGVNILVVGVNVLHRHRYLEI